MLMFWVTSADPDVKVVAVKDPFRPLDYMSTNSSTTEPTGGFYCDDEWDLPAEVVDAKTTVEESPVAVQRTAPLAQCRSSSCTFCRGVGVPYADTSTYTCLTGHTLNRAADESRQFTAAYMSVFSDVVLRVATRRLAVACTKDGGAK